MSSQRQNRSKQVRKIRVDVQRSRDTKPWEIDDIQSLAAQRYFPANEVWQTDNSVGASVVTALPASNLIRETLAPPTIDAWPRKQNKLSSLSQKPSDADNIPPLMRKLNHLVWEGLRSVGLLVDRCIEEYSIDPDSHELDCGRSTAGTFSELSTSRLILEVIHRFMDNVELLVKRQREEAGLEIITNSNSNINNNIRNSKSAITFSSISPFTNEEKEKLILELTEDNKRVESVLKNLCNAVARWSIFEQAGDIFSKCFATYEAAITEVMKECADCVDEVLSVFMSELSILRIKLASAKADVRFRAEERNKFVAERDEQFHRAEAALREKEETAVKLAAKDKELKSLHFEIEDRDRTIQKMSDESDLVSKQFTAQEYKISKLSSQLSMANERIDSLNIHVADLKRNLAQSETVAAAGAAETLALRQQLASAKIASSNARSDLNKLQADRNFVRQQLNAFTSASGSAMNNSENNHVVNSSSNKDHGASSSATTATQNGGGFVVPFCDVNEWMETACRMYVHEFESRIDTAIYGDGSSPLHDLRSLHQKNQQHYQQVITTLQQQIETLRNQLLLAGSGSDAASNMMNNNNNLSIMSDKKEGSQKKGGGTKSKRKQKNVKAGISSEASVLTSPAPTQLESRNAGERDQSPAPIPPSNGELTSANQSLFIPVIPDHIANNNESGSEIEQKQQKQAKQKQLLIQQQHEKQTKEKTENIAQLHQPEIKTRNPTALQIVAIADEQARPFFVGLGNDPYVPMPLRYVGKVPNLHLGLETVSNLIIAFFRDTAENFPKHQIAEFLDYSFQSAFSAAVVAYHNHVQQQQQNGNFSASFQNNNHNSSKRKPTFSSVDGSGTVTPNHNIHHLQSRRASVFPPASQSCSHSDFSSLQHPHQHHSMNGDSGLFLSPSTSMAAAAAAALDSFPSLALAMSNSQAKNLIFLVNHWISNHLDCEDAVPPLYNILYSVRWHSYHPLCRFFDAAVRFDAPSSLWFAVSETISLFKRTLEQSVPDVFSISEASVQEAVKKTFATSLPTAAVTRISVVVHNFFHEQMEKFEQQQNYNNNNNNQHQPGSAEISLRSIFISGFDVAKRKHRRMLISRATKEDTSSPITWAADSVDESLIVREIRNECLQSWFDLMSDLSESIVDRAIISPEGHVTPYSIADAILRVDPVRPKSSMDKIMQTLFGSEIKVPGAVSESVSVSPVPSSPVVGDLERVGSLRIHNNNNDNNNLALTLSPEEQERKLQKLLEEDLLVGINKEENTNNNNSGKQDAPPIQYKNYSELYRKKKYSRGDILLVHEALARLRMVPLARYTPPEEDF